MEDGEATGSIANTVLEILESAPDQEMFVAALGNRLAETLKLPLQEALGGVKLTDVLRARLGEQIDFSGTRDRLIAKLVAPERQQPDLPLPDGTVAPRELEGSGGDVPRRYDRSFWAAFVKPIRKQHRRAIDPNSPFKWSDFLGGEIPAGWIEIEASVFTDPAEPWTLRKRAVGMAIERWCDRHRLPPERFVADQSSGEPGPRVHLAGAMKLLELIREVPEDRRSQQTMNLELIHTLLARH